MTDKAVEDMKHIMEAVNTASNINQVADDLVANLAAFMDRLTLSDCETFARDVRYVMDDVVRRRVALKQVDPIPQKSPEQEEAELKVMTPHEREVAKMRKILRVIKNNSLFDAEPVSEEPAAPTLTIEDINKQAETIKVLDNVNVELQLAEVVSQDDLSAVKQALETLRNDFATLQSAAVDTLPENWLDEAQASYRAFAENLRAQDEANGLHQDTNPEPVNSLGEMPDAVADQYIEGRLNELDAALFGIESQLKQEYQNRQDVLNDIRALNERISQNEAALSEMHKGIQRQLAEITEALKKN